MDILRRSIVALIFVLYDFPLVFGGLSESTALACTRFGPPALSNVLDYKPALRLRTSLIRLHYLSATLSLGDLSP